MRPASPEAEGSDKPTSAGDPAPETLGVRLRLRRHGVPRAGEPYEVLTGVQREAGRLDADGCVRFRVPLSTQAVTISVGSTRRVRIALAVIRDSSANE